MTSQFAIATSSVRGNGREPDVRGFLVDVAHAARRRGIKMCNLSIPGNGHVPVHAIPILEVPMTEDGIGGGQGTPPQAVRDTGVNSLTIALVAIATAVGIAIGSLL